jgi:hypothetical protein
MFFTKWSAGCFAVLLLALVAAPAMSAPRLLEQAAATASLAQRAGQNSALAETLQALAEDAAQKGLVEVAVKTAVAFAPEPLLSQWEQQVQRRDIAAAARALRSALPEAKSFTARDDVPYVLLGLDADGLARLKTLPGVVLITPAQNLNWQRDFVELRTAQADPGASQATAISGRSIASNIAISPRIVGGQTADPATHPFQVALLIKSRPNNRSAQFCGGTLVSERHVVTAAHCSDMIRNAAEEVEVLVGTQSLVSGGQRIGVSRVTIHPRFRARTFDYDVAVWQLASTVTGIPFASITSTQPTIAGTPLRVTGWGTMIMNTLSRPADLQQVDVPFVPTAGRRCAANRSITSRMICAGESGRDSCQGDSGGPLTIDRGSGYSELVGIVSFGRGCGLPSYPGVYTNVAEGSINSFIKETVFAPPRTISLSVTSQSVTEVARGRNRTTLTVERSSASGAASVRYSLTPGTATAGKDYRARTGTVRFKRGSTTATLSVFVMSDKLTEEAETFNVNLSEPSAGYTIASGTATVTIIDLPRMVNSQTAANGR